MIYHYIIIGAGISGLYTGYKLQKKYPDKNILIIEKEDRLGGRAGNYEFAGASVVIGAGIGRKEKDQTLEALIHELELPTSDFQVQLNYSSTFKNIDTTKLITITKQLQKKYLQYIEKKIEQKKSFTFPTCKEFATEILGKKEYQEFIQLAGYTDYENEHAYETLFHYGMEDSASGWIGFSVPWEKIITTLAEKIGMQSIKLNQAVKTITLDKPKNLYRVKIDSSDEEYSTENIIFATTVNGYNTIVKHSPTIHSILPSIKDIASQPFLRAYAQFTPEVSEILKNYIPKHSIVPSPLHRVIPMNVEKNVYMIAYTDNKDATMLSKHCENTAKNRTFFEQELEQAFGMPKDSLKKSLQEIKCFYWKEGTHFMMPPTYKEFERFIQTNSNVQSMLEAHKQDTLQNIRNPHPHIFVVGEIVADNHGWTNDGLKTVDALIKNIA